MSDATPTSDAQAYLAAVALYDGLPVATRRAVRAHVTSDLEREGWHHEDDCTVYVEPEGGDDDEADTIEHAVGEINGSLTDWHDRTHGLTHYPSCTQEPCALIHPDLRAMPALHLTR